MAKKAKERKVTEENKKWYRLGYLNGLSRREQTIKKLQVAYGHLFDELVRLDDEEPRAGVMLNYNDIRTVIRQCKRAKNYWFANKITKKMEEAQAKDAHLVLMSLKQLTSD